MKKTKIKIAILIDQLIPGGVQKTAIEEVRNLRKLGYDCSLLILMRKGFENKQSFSANKNLSFAQNLDSRDARIKQSFSANKHSFSTNKNRYLTKNIPYQFLSDRYPRIFQKSFKLPIFRFLSSLHLLSPILAPLKIKTKEFDIIISHGTTTTLTAWTIFRFRNIPYIAIIHDPMVYILEKIYSKTLLLLFFPLIKPLASFLEKILITGAKTCIVDSHVHAAYIKNKYKVNPQILYLAIDSTKTIPTKRGDKIISFGRWDAGKNLALLLDLMQKLPQAKLIIAGSWSSTSELKEFKRQIRVKKLQNNIELITYYTEKGLANICQQGRFWIHPHFESFSLSALEAAGFGLPIVIPQKSGITELFQDGKHGFFLKNMDIDKLQKVTQKLLNDERLAWQMGYQASEIVRKLASQSVHAKKLAKIITKSTKAHQKKLVALETGQVGTQGVAGGDQLLNQMLKRIKTPYEITVIVPRLHTKEWQKSATGVKLLELPTSAFDKSINQLIIFINYLVRSARSIRILLKKRPDAIYSATEILPDVLPAYVTKIIKPHTLWIARSHHLWAKAQERPGNYFINFASTLLQSILLKAIKDKADIILALNVSLKLQLEDRGFEPRKVVVLGGGVDFQKIADFKAQNTQKYDAIFLGRIHPAKGVFDLPTIWKGVTSVLPQAKLAIIGPGPENIVNSLKIQIKKFNIDKKIQILGFIPQTDVLSYLKNAKVFIFSDHEAGFGLAAAQAMACGLPVIGYNIGILGNVYKKGYLKVPLSDKEAFVNRIVEVLQNTTLRKKLAKDAREEAARHDWQKVALKFRQILDTINS